MPLTAPPSPAFRPKAAGSPRPACPGYRFIHPTFPHTLLTIYKASAGSGKTYTLSSTFIAHLLGDRVENAHKHILAVTFTNKATAEMKERILQNLYTIAYDSGDGDGFFADVRKKLPKGMTDDAIRRHARSVMNALIHDYDHFHVKTIDSFFQSLLANLAHEVGLSASFKVEIDDKNILRKAVDRFLAGVREGSDELEWLMRFVSQRLEDDASWNVTSELCKLSKELLKEKYLQQRQLLHRKELSAGDAAAFPQSIDLTNDTVNNYRGRLQAIEKELRKKLAAAATEANAAIEHSVGYDSISHGKDWIEPPIRRIADAAIPYSALDNLSPSFRKYADGNTEILKAAKRKDATACQQGETVREYLRRLVETFDESAYAFNSCALSLKNIYPLRLLDCIDHEVESLNRENNRFMLAKTPLLFAELAGGTDSSFIFERAGTQFFHVMIDEFQDTSPLQWQNMHHLLVENLAQGNSCMLVGDVKQGIYRFRGGDWNTLADFKEEGSGAEKTVEIRTLKQNFRSGKEIVRFNNSVFTATPTIIDGWLSEMWGAGEEGIGQELSACRIYPVPDPGNDTHEVTQIDVKEGGYVRIEFLEKDSSKGKGGKHAKNQPQTVEAEAGTAEDTPEEKEEVEEMLAKQIERLHGTGVPYEEMAILVRSNRESTPILRHFEANFPHIPLVSEEAFLLDASPAVQTLIHALQYISNTSDSISREYVIQKAPAGKRDEILQLLEQWNREHYSGLPFYEIATRLIGILQLDDMPGQSPYLYCFLDTVLKYIDENPSDIKEFLRDWNESLHRTSLPSAAIKGVRILTIHKSKGLAFHSVFIPYNDWLINDPKKPERVWATPSAAPYDGIPLLPIDLTEKAGKSIYSDLYRQEQYNLFIENLNIMYVAFTRAKQNLLVWGTPSKGDKTVNVAFLLREAMKKHGLLTAAPDGNGGNLYEAGQPSRRDIKTDGTPMTDYGNPETAKARHPLDYRARVINMEYKVSEASPHFRQSQNARLFIEMEQGLDTAGTDAKDGVQRENFRQTGILLHQLMSTIETLDDVPGQIAAFVREGRIPPGQQAESLQRLIHNRIQHPTARKWFDGTWTLYREATLIFRDDAGRTVSKRPDRVMKRDGETVVVDFKFGRPKPEYSEQIRHYASLLRRQGNHSVKAYIWYLYSGDIDEVEV